jgi:hypothetical protein
MWVPWRAVEALAQRAVTHYTQPSRLLCLTFFTPLIFTNNSATISCPSSYIALFSVAVCTQGTYKCP